MPISCLGRFPKQNRIRYLWGQEHRSARREGNLIPNPSLGGLVPTEMARVSVGAKGIPSELTQDP